MWRVDEDKCNYRLDMNSWTKTGNRKSHGIWHENRWWNSYYTMFIDFVCESVERDESVIDISESVKRCWESDTKCKRRCMCEVKCSVEWSGVEWSGVVHFISLHFNSLNCIALLCSAVCYWVLWSIDIELCGADELSAVTCNSTSVGCIVRSDLVKKNTIG